MPSNPADLPFLSFRETLTISLLVIDRSKISTHFLEKSFSFLMTDSISFSKSLSVTLETELSFLNQSNQICREMLSMILFCLASFILFTIDQKSLGLFDSRL